MRAALSSALGTPVRSCRKHGTGQDRFFIQKYCTQAAAGSFTAPFDAVAAFFPYKINEQKIRSDLPFDLCSI